MLLESEGVSSFLVNFDFDLRLSVSSFTVTIIDSSVFKTVSSLGNKFTSEQKELFQKMKNNDRLIIEDIEVKMPIDHQKIKTNYP